MKMAPILRAPSPQPGRAHHRPHRPALRRRDERRLLPRPGASGSRREPRRRLRLARGADRQDDGRSRAGVRSLRARLDRGLRRRELDARRGTGGGEEGHEGGARRGRRAELRSLHAGGSQSRPDRPARRRLPDAGRLRRPEPASRGHSRRAHPRRRQCHGRYPAGTPSQRREARHAGSRWAWPRATTPSPPSTAPATWTIPPPSPRCSPA